MKECDGDCSYGVLGRGVFGCEDCGALISQERLLEKLFFRIQVLEAKQQAMRVELKFLKMAKTIGEEAA